MLAQCRDFIDPFNKIARSELRFSNRLTSQQGNKACLFPSASQSITTPFFFSTFTKRNRALPMGEVRALPNLFVLGQVERVVSMSHKAGHHPALHSYQPLLFNSSSPLWIRRDDHGIGLRKAWCAMQAFSASSINPRMTSWDSSLSINT